MIKLSWLNLRPEFYVYTEKLLSIITLKVGISLDRVTRQLEDKGVEKFNKSFGKPVLTGEQGGYVYSAAVFLISGLSKHDWLEAFPFAITATYFPHEQPSFAKVHRSGASDED